MEVIVTVVYGFCSLMFDILDVAALIDPPLFFALLWSVFGICENEFTQNISPFEVLSDF